MEHVPIAHTASDQASARGLATNLQTHGFRVLLEVPHHGSEEPRPEVRQARCTLVLWSATAQADPGIKLAAETAMRYNVQIPIRQQNSLPEEVPDRYRRTRPDIIPELASREPLCLDDVKTLVGVISHLWRVPIPRPAVSAVDFNAQGEPRRRDWTWVFLLPAAWLAFCLLVALAVDAAIKHSNPFTAVRALNANAAYVTARRRHAQKLDWLTPTPDRITLAPQPLKPFEQGQRVTILVHGYNVRTALIGNYFDDVIAHLRTGSSATRQFVIFDWPSGARASEALGPLWHFWSLFDPFLGDTVATEAEMYNVGRQNARGRSSNAFLTLVDSIHASTGAKIDIIAHSMGCYLVLEAIRKRSDLATKINKLMLLAAAVPYDALEDTSIASALADVSRVGVFHSTKDSVLAVYGSLRHGGPMLGGVGPKTVARLPPNVRTYDETARILARDVHGAYLRLQGLQAISLAKALDE